MKRIDEKIERYLSEETYKKQPEWDEIRNLLVKADNKIIKIENDFEKNLEQLSFNAKLVLADEEDDFWFWIRKVGEYDDKDPIFDTLRWFADKLERDPKIKQAVIDKKKKEAFKKYGGGKL